MGNINGEKILTTNYSRARTAIKSPPKQKNNLFQLLTIDDGMKKRNFMRNVRNEKFDGHYVN